MPPNPRECPFYQPCSVSPFQTQIPPSSRFPSQPVTGFLPQSSPNPLNSPRLEGIQSSPTNGLDLPVVPTPPPRGEKHKPGWTRQTCPSLFTDSIWNCDHELQRPTVGPTPVVSRGQTVDQRDGPRSTRRFLFFHPRFVGCDVNPRWGLDARGVDGWVRALERRAGTSR